MSGHVARLRRPREPTVGECCGSGCARCVWDIYFEKTAAFEAAAARGETDDTDNTTTANDDEDEDGHGADLSPIGSVIIKYVTAFEAEGGAGALDGGTMGPLNASYLGRTLQGEESRRRRNQTLSQRGTADDNNDTSDVPDLQAPLEVWGRADPPHRSAWAPVVGAAVVDASSRLGEEGATDTRKGPLALVRLQLNVETLVTPPPPQGAPAVLGSGGGGPVTLQETQLPERAVDIVPGDVLEVLVPNGSAECERLCALLRVAPDRRLQLLPSPFVPAGAFPAWLRASPAARDAGCTVGDFFAHCVDITSSAILRPPLFETLLRAARAASRSGPTNSGGNDNHPPPHTSWPPSDEALLAALAAHPRAICQLADRLKPSLVHVLAAFPAAVPQLPRLLEALGPLKPRSFSIAGTSADLGPPPTPLDGSAPVSVIVAPSSGQAQPAGHVELLVRLTTESRGTATHSPHSPLSSSSAEGDDVASVAAAFRWAAAELLCGPPPPSSLPLPPAPTAASRVALPPFVGHTTGRLGFGGSFARLVAVRGNASPASPRNHTNSSTVPLLSVPLFHFPPPAIVSGAPLVLVAGGSGFAPLRPLIRRAAALGFGRVVLLCAVHSCEEAALVHRVAAAAMWPGADRAAAQEDDVDALPPSLPHASPASCPLTATYFVSGAAPDDSPTDGSTVRQPPTGLTLPGPHQYLPVSGSTRGVPLPLHGRIVPGRMVLQTPLEALRQAPFAAPSAGPHFGDLMTRRELMAALHPDHRAPASAARCCACGPPAFLAAFRDALVHLFDNGVPGGNGPQSPTNGPAGLSAGPAAGNSALLGDNDRHTALHHLRRLIHDRVLIFDCWN